MGGKDTGLVCYLCGSGSEITKDHIPPKNLFPHPRPTDLISVPCCRECNNYLSPIDESFRVFVSSVAKRSSAGDTIWKKEVVGKTFNRSPKLKEAFRSGIITKASIASGISTLVTYIQYPEESACIYLNRLTKGFLYHLNPNLDFRNFHYDVVQLIPDQNNVDMLYSSSYYLEKGDAVFRMWRMLSEGDKPIGYFVYVFYDALIFLVKVNM